MRQHPVDVDLEAPERVVVTGLQVRERAVRNLRERALPLSAGSLEVGKRRVPLHPGRTLAEVVVLLEEGGRDGVRVLMLQLDLAVQRYELARGQVGADLV